MGRHPRASAPRSAAEHDDPEPRSTTRVRLADLGSNVGDVVVALTRSPERSTAVVVTLEDGENLVLERDSDAMRLLQALADAHRERRRSRARAGLQAARSLGRTGGRPTVVDGPRRREIARLLTARARNGRQLYSYAEIAARTGVSRSTIARHAKTILATVEPHR